MISTSIDGSASNSLFDLLSVVAKPDVFADKLKQLQDATAEYQAMVTLAGPASEILAIRERIAAEKQAAEQAGQAAKAQAEMLVDDAQKQARQIVADAQAESTRMRNEAQKLMSDALAAKSEVAVQQQVLMSAKSAAANAKADFEAKASMLDDQIKAARAAEIEAQQTRADILAKHQAFIASL